MTTIEAAQARTRHTRGLLLLLVVVLAWGAVWPVNKVLLESIPPLWAVAMRMGIGGAALLCAAAKLAAVVVVTRVLPSAGVAVAPTHRGWVIHLVLGLMIALLLLAGAVTG